MTRKRSTSVSVMLRVTGEPFVTSTPTAVSRSTALNGPGIWFCACVPLRVTTVNPEKLLVPSTFSIAVSSRKILLLPSSRPSISPSLIRSRTLANCTDCRVSSASVGVRLPPPPNLPPPPAPWMYLVWVMLAPDQRLSRWIAQPIQQINARKRLARAYLVAEYLRY